MGTDPESKTEALTDRLGRAVDLSEERWRHIVEGHPEMEGLQQEVKAAIVAAEKRTRGRFEDTELLWVRNLGPARWLVVVVRYEGNRGWIRTAHGSTRDPKAEHEL